MSNLQLHESGAPLTMSSREIAELTGKRHDHVVRDIQKMIADIEKDSPNLGHQAKSTGYEIERDNRGYVSVIHLDRSHTYTLMTGYDAKQRKKLVDRWMELEGAAPREISREEQLARAVLLSNEMLREKDEQISVLTPKADGFDRLANSIGRTNLREVGKVLQIGSQRGIEMLREIKWTYRDQAGRWHAYADKIDAGLLEVKFHTFTNTSGEERSTQQVFVTPKGMTRLAARLGQN